MTELFIDTDIGGDVDDALALAIALRCPQIRVVGVSTVYLRPAWRAQTAAEVFRRAGAPMPPIAAGCGSPLCGRWEEKHIPDTGVLPPEPVPLSPLHGSELLLRCARSNPALNILAIGPLTNIALALKQDSAAFRDCTLWMMGGRLKSARPEWNCQCDPEALHMVFSSGVRVNLVPFEWTSQSQLTQAEMDAFTGTPGREYLQGMMESFAQRFGFRPMLHDPMALAMLVCPELFTLRAHRVEVETQGTWTRGALVDFGACDDGNVHVVEHVEMAPLMAWMKSMLMAL